MDATRSRRTQDEWRLRWYALWRTSRFAVHMGFAPKIPLNTDPGKDRERRGGCESRNDYSSS